MAGLKQPSLTEFYRRLHARGETATTLACRLGLERHSYVARTAWTVRHSSLESSARLLPFPSWASVVAKAFVKQLGALPVSTASTTLDQRLENRIRDKKGGDMAEWPPHLCVREVPDFAIAEVDHA